MHSQDHVDDPFRAMFFSKKIIWPYGATSCLRLRLDVWIGGYGIELGSIPNQPWYWNEIQLQFYCLGCGSVLRLGAHAWDEYRLALRLISNSEFYVIQTVDICICQFQFRIPSPNIYIQTLSNSQIWLFMNTISRTNFKYLPRSLIIPFVMLMRSVHANQYVMHIFGSEWDNGWFFCNSRHHGRKASEVAV